MAQKTKMETGEKNMVERDKGIKTKEKITYEKKCFKYTAKNGLANADFHFSS